MIDKGPDAQDFGKVAVLMGGWSAEREVSLKSGQAVLSALSQRGVNAHGVDVRMETIVQQLQQGSFDRAFIALHGRGGEDGVIQGVLEVLGIPYTGSGVLASALAMDKLRTKQLLVGMGLPTPDFMLLQADSDFEHVVASLGLPLSVKPALEGSSLGMTKVNSVDQLSAAWATATQFEGPVLVESWIEGDEYTVSILGDKALPTIRLETPREFYDYAAKYEADTTQFFCPCGLSPEQEGRLQKLALSAFNAVGARGWGRVDLFIDKHNKPWIIEVNTVPGMTDHSLVPLSAKTAGLAFSEVLWRILAQTLVNHPSNNGAPKEVAYVCPL